MIKLLVVDDSALMRRHLVQLFEKQKDFLVSTARNGVEALQALDDFDPDVIALDINMPGMDGLTCLSRIMVQRPKPVVMVSSLTEEGAEATLEALELGAVDFVRKPDGTISLDIGRIEHELVFKIRAAAAARLRQSRGLRSRLTDRRTPRSPERFMAGQGGAKVLSLAPLSRDRLGLVLIGVSTGGPGTLEDILPRLPLGFPWPVIIAQHMPSSFTGVLARRFATLCALPVSEVVQQVLLEGGHIYIARGDADIVFRKTALGLMALPAPANKELLWHPSVTRMVDSAMTVLPATMLIGVQLTGMGDDGAQSMATLHEKGGRTIAQDEATSVVYGMPGELVSRGGADHVLPAHRIAQQLVSWFAVDDLPGGVGLSSSEVRHGSR